MGAKPPFRYAQGLQQLQDRKETKKYRLTKTETKKVCRDFHVKWIGKGTFCTFCKSTGDLHSGADRQSAGNERYGEAAPQLRPYGSRCDPQSALLVYLQSNVPFSSAEEKYHCPPAMESRKEPASLPREREKDAPFVM